MKFLDLKKNWKYMVLSLVVVIAGVGTAWVIYSNLLSTGNANAPTSASNTTNGQAGYLASGIDYKDATGTLLAGGTGNEGTHHLERDGGASQTVYLTSSTIDLESFVGKKVRVWGVTLASKKAGWLMDVAKIAIQ